MERQNERGLAYSLLTVVLGTLGLFFVTLPQHVSWCPVMSNAASESWRSFEAEAGVGSETGLTGELGQF